MMIRKPLRLNGVDHTARPTWKLRETIEFYRDVIGLPLVHTISARGWGTKTHPDFLHFFFDSGNGSSIAFFYYLGSKLPPALEGRGRHSAPIPEDHEFDATHTGWTVDTVDELHAWREHLQSRGVTVSAETTHEVVESIYFRDPNGYLIEISRRLRGLSEIDAMDASLTLQAAIELEEEAKLSGRRLTSIDAVWNRKAKLLEAEMERRS